LATRWGWLFIPLFIVTINLVILTTDLGLLSNYVHLCMTITYIFVYKFIHIESKSSAFLSSFLLKWGKMLVCKINKNCPTHFPRDSSNFFHFQQLVLKSCV
jgi:hypothetical protein